MSRRPKNRKPLAEQINCFNCTHCLYIGEGDHICDMTYEIVIEDWTPAEDYYKCEGKDFEH